MPIKKTFQTNWKKNVLIILFFSLLTGWYFSPLLNHLTIYLPDDLDGLLITWLITRMARNFPQLPTKLFQANIFHPHPFSHAYSDPFITAGLLAKPFLLITPEPIISFNINLILAQFFTLLFSFLFFKQLTQKPWWAFVFSIIFTFSPIHLHYLTHLHTFMIQFLPLAGVCLLKLKASQKIIWLYVWAGCFILQMANNFLVGYFILFLSIALVFGCPKIRQILRDNWLDVFITLNFLFWFIFPVINIYRQVSQHFDYVRPITEVIHFSLSPEELITKFFSPIIYGLALIALGFFLKKPKQRTKIGLSFLFLAAGALILSLGPALHWQKQTIKIPFHLPLPYLFFYFLAPGFKGFRTPSRWLMLFSFASLTFSLLQLIKVERLIKAGYRRQFKFIFLLTLLFLTFISLDKFNNYLAFPQTQNYPAVYHWLKNQPERVIIELPIHTWSCPNAKEENYRLLYSLYHQKTMINGASGYYPEAYNQLVGSLKNNFPSQQAIQTIKSLGVELIIIHQDEYAKIWLGETDQHLKILNQLDQVRLIKNFGSSLVYEVKD